MKTQLLTIFLFFSVSQSVADNAVSYLYAHGIAHDHEQGYWYLKKTPHGVENKRYLVNGRLFTFDFPDATKGFWRVNFVNTSLGQANELISLYQAYQRSLSTLAQEARPTDLVFLGLSRGASTGVVFLGLFKTPHIKAAVLESPFDSHHNLVQGILKKIYLDTVPGMQTVGSWLMQAIFMQHKRNGICPLDTVTSIQKDMPIILICSKQDTIVPYTGTVELYKRLRASGHNHTYLLVLETGKHAQILTDVQGDLYQNTVHAFYKKYKLPHNPIFALQGEQSLNCCQPDPETLNYQ